MSNSEVFLLFLSQGYVVRISGGNDKQGFPMKQGVLTHGRVRLLLSKGHSCYRPRRTGERKRKSVRGCIVDANLSVLNLVIVKKGKSLEWNSQYIGRHRHPEGACLVVVGKLCGMEMAVPVSKHECILALHSCNAKTGY